MLYVNIETVLAQIGYILLKKKWSSLTMKKMEKIWPNFH